LQIIDLAKVKGIIFDLQRFSIHDGPGIRTTVFFKGCPLNCIWCHNPESKERQSEIAFYPEKCLHCGSCVGVCPTQNHLIQDGKHVFNRENCTRCGLCAQRCYAKALDEIGREMTSDEVIQEVIKDKAFYLNSGGGITLSGGEPLYQFEFAFALLKIAKDLGLHTCIETSGAVSFNSLRKIIGYTDLFLYDIKETDAFLSEKYIGANSEGILKNLNLLDSNGGHIILRCPVIPGLNDRLEHFRRIGELANQLENVIGIDVLTYHPLGVSKTFNIGKLPLFSEMTFPSESTVKGWAETIRKYTMVPVKI